MSTRRIGDIRPYPNHKRNPAMVYAETCSKVYAETCSNSLGRILVCGRYSPGTCDNNNIANNERKAAPRRIMFTEVSTFQFQSKCSRARIGGMVFSFSRIHVTFILL